MSKRPSGADREHTPLGPIDGQIVGTVGEQDFDRGYASQFVAQAIGRDHGGLESAGRDVDPCQTTCLAGSEGQQKVTFCRVEQRVVGDGATADDASDLTADQGFSVGFGLFGIFDLFADSGAHSGSDDFGQIAIELMVRKPSHRDRVGTFVAAGERKPKHPSGRFGVVEKQLVKIAHAKQQQGIAGRGLGLVVLPSSSAFG